MSAVFVKLLGIIALGFGFGLGWDVLSRARGLPDSTELRRRIGQAVLYFFLPALVARALLSSPLGQETWGVPLVAIGSTLGALAVAWLIYDRWLLAGKHLARPAAGAMLLASSWSNATYLGIPIVTAIYGAGMARVPVLFDLLALTPLLLTLGVIIGERYGKRDPKRLPLWLSLAKLPPLQIAILALILQAARVPVPDSALTVLGWISGFVGPLMLFALGLALRPHGLRRLPTVVPSVVIKLAVAPALAFWLAPRIGLTAEVAQVAVLEAAMPSMVLPLVIADRHRLDTDLLALAIALSTLVFIGVLAGAFTLGLYN